MDRAFLECIADTHFYNVISCVLRIRETNHVIFNLCNDEHLQLSNMIKSKYSLRDSSVINIRRNTLANFYYFSRRKGDLGNDQREINHYFVKKKFVTRAND